MSFVLGILALLFLVAYRVFFWLRDGAWITFTLADFHFCDFDCVLEETFMTDFGGVDKIILWYFQLPIEFSAVIPLMLFGAHLEET